MSSLKSYFERILPMALDAGMSIVQFWDSTVGEIKLMIDAFNRKRKSDISDVYLNAKLIASFVGCSINGKQIPEIYDLFPEMFADEQA